jgi:glutamate/tyrosine decarboxylase-like PLP-dependent enzyme
LDGRVEAEVGGPGEAVLRVLVPVELLADASQQRMFRQRVDGYERMIADDIALARSMYDAAAAHPELEAITHALSIATFRYVPAGFDRGRAGAEEYLDRLNAEIVERVQGGGDAFLTHAVIGGRFVLRACIVNFRTSAGDVRAGIEAVVGIGRRVHRELGGG